MNVELNDKQMTVARFIANGAGDNNDFTRSIRSILGRNLNFSSKHNFEFDFGYKSDIDFLDNYRMYKRNGIAKALVGKRVAKTWETNPELLEREEEHDETGLEAEIYKHFSAIRFWQQLQEVDKRFHVGDYAAVIFQLADNKQFSEPVDSVPGGIDGLINIIPAWEGQLEITQVNQDQNSPRYGEPEMMTFTESNVDSEQHKIRSFYVHPDRVYIWSQDRTIFNDSFLEVMQNALIDMEKIRGGGAEGFWKNSKSQPVLEAAPDVNFQQLAGMLGTDVEGLPDALDNVVADWSKGHDQSLVLQGMKAYTLGVTMPNPKEFYDIPLGEVAAAADMPVRVLTGNQTGERASTEDAAAFNKSMMSRRNNVVIPNIKDVIARLERFGVLPERDWYCKWEDLTGASIEQKFERAGKMADVNQKMLGTGDAVFDVDEIRDQVDMLPLDEDIGGIEVDEEEDEADRENG